MSMGDPPFGVCVVCGGPLTADHVCSPISEKNQQWLPMLTEEDVRRIVREELKKANVGVKYKYGAPR